MTAHFFTSPSPTRTGRCHNCNRHHIPVTNHLCEACQKVQDAQEQAFDYADKIVAPIHSENDLSNLSAALRRLIFLTGEQSPLILQAVWDRAEYLDQITYPAVCEIARYEVAALGLEVAVY